MRVLGIQLMHLLTKLICLVSRGAPVAIPMPVLSLFSHIGRNRWYVTLGEVHAYLMHVEEQRRQCNSPWEAEVVARAKAERQAELEWGWNYQHSLGWE